MATTSKTHLKQEASYIQIFFLYFEKQLVYYCIKEKHISNLAYSILQTLRF